MNQNNYKNYKQLNKYSYTHTGNFWGCKISNYVLRKNISFSTKNDMVKNEFQV